MALGLGETVFGIVLRERGVKLEPQTGDEPTARKKRGLIKSGTFVACSGAVLVLFGIAVQKYGLP
jgi:hypothetical protein